MMETVFEGPALHDVRRLVEAAGLPTDDLDQVDLSHFLSVGSTQGMIGVVGLEILGEAALLRSLAVDPSARGKGIGLRLVAEAERHANGLGVRAVYVLTTTAEPLFARLGYRREDRDRAPAAIRRTREFATLCPDSAAFMVKEIS